MTDLEKLIALEDFINDNTGSWANADGAWLVIDGGLDKDELIELADKIKELWGE